MEYAREIHQINEKLLTNFSQRADEQSIFYNNYLARIFYFFSYAKHVENEFYNCLAFDLVQDALGQLFRGQNPHFDRKTVLFGVFLIKCKDFAFLEADLDKTFQKIDSNCKLLCGMKIVLVEDLLITLIYLVNRSFIPSMLAKDFKKEITLLLRKLVDTLARDLEKVPEDSQLLKILFLARLLRGNTKKRTKVEDSLEALLISYHSMIQKRLKNEDIKLSPTLFCFLFEFKTLFGCDTGICKNVDDDFKNCKLITHLAQYFSLLKTNSLKINMQLAKANEIFKVALSRVDFVSNPISTSIELGLILLFLDQPSKEQMDFIWILK